MRNKLCSSIEFHSVVVNVVFVAQSWSFCRKLQTFILMVEVAVKALLWTAHVVVVVVCPVLLV